MHISDKILLGVEKPARYLGNEINMVEKDVAEVDVRFAMCFPDVYEIGMSHLGMQILYFFLNRRKDIYCERAYAVWHDMEQAMRKEKLPLFSLETKTPLNNFDFVGFTLQYEMSYTNILNMLDLSNIPFLSKDRGEDSPIICAGGPCAYNPEPLADVVDFFYIGEGEVMLDKIIDLYKENKANGGTKDMFLEKLLEVDGVYVPKFYDVCYGENGKISSFTPNHKNAKPTIRKVLVNDFDKSFFPEKQLVPLIETVHDRVTLEVFRGCMRGCRFCQAGYVYRPVRERESDTLLNHADKLVKATGHEEISLVSLSTGDYSQFYELSTGIIDKYKDDRVNISLPSLRIDAFSLDLMNKVQEVRKSSLTFAPEAGTQKLRDVINKGITEEEILTGSGQAFEGGWNRVKLYFMIGLPTETEEDLLGIVQLSEKIVEKYYENGKRSRPPSIVVSTSCFIPKPFTPFQWEPQNEYTQFMDKQRIIKKSFTKRQVKYNYHDAGLSIIEGVVSRGDRRVCAAIIKAWEMGARFDGWSEHFNFNLWLKAIEETGLEVSFYTGGKSLDEILPWDHIDVGVTKRFFIKEREKALSEQTTPNCREACTACGAAVFKGGVCIGE